MKDIHSLIRQKEGELERIQRELEALRLSAKLLEDDARPTTTAAPVVPAAVYNPAPAKPQNPGQAAANPSAWASAKQFP